MKAGEELMCSYTDRPITQWKKGGEETKKPPQCSTPAASIFYAVTQSTIAAKAGACLIPISKEAKALIPTLPDAKSEYGSIKTSIFANIAIIN